MSTAKPCKLSQSSHAWVKTLWELKLAKIGLGMELNCFKH